MRPVTEFELRRLIYQNAHAFFDEGEPSARAQYLSQLRDAIQNYDFRAETARLDAADPNSQAFGVFACSHCGKPYPHHHYPCPKCGKPTLNAVVQPCGECEGDEPTLAENLARMGIRR